VSESGASSLMYELADGPPGDGRIRILHIVGCPLLDRLRTEVELALEGLGAAAPVEETEGPYPSPTLLIDGLAIDGQPAGRDPVCRIDLPTRAEIVAALVAAGIGSPVRSSGHRDST
jgi:hypothetical protein